MLSNVVHSALSTCIRPYATLFDGDVIFMVSIGDRRPNYLSVLQGLYESVTEAVLHSVLLAEGLPNLPSRSDIIKK
jgi:L-aminopeptidase/D-esterase-like protein